MRVFVTGASGFIGSVVVPELISAGHQVLGLARSEASAQALIKAGAEVHRGSLEDVESLKAGAAAADGVIHLAFIHDFSNFAQSCETDYKAIEAMGSVLAGTSKPLVITSGTAIVQPKGIITEKDVITAATGTTPRGASEELMATLAGKGVRTSIVRLPPSVHDKGGYGFVSVLLQTAQQKGVAAYVGEGTNRWPAVHRKDAARVFRLALERAATNATYHAIGDEGVTLREINTTIGKLLNIPVVSKTAAEAAEHFGWMSGFLAMDAPATALLTKEQLNWQPTHPGLIADLETGFN